jgi:shikimate dehydrogenase
MTDRYAVIGNPIGHSKSPLIHGTFARDTHQDLEYGLIEAPLDGFVAAALAFRAAGGRGMNVTTPFKVEAFQLAHERLPRAQLAGAANALKFDGDRIVADNFDGVGLLNDIQRNLNVALRGKRVLVLGAGRRRAGRAVAAPRGAAGRHHDLQPRGGQGARAGIGGRGGRARRPRADTRTSRAARSTSCSTRPRRA